MTRTCSTVLTILGLATVGVAGFPDTLHNVGVSEILCPRGTIDSGTSVVPCVIVTNYGSATETLSVVTAIEGGYRDSVYVPALAGHSCDTLSLAEFTIHANESLDVWSWTACGNDSFPWDDTAWVRFLARVIDVAVTDIVVPSEIDSGERVVPQAWVWSYGNVSVSFPLEFRIDTVYCCTAWVQYLIPRGQQLVWAPDTWIAQPGRWELRVSAIVDGDLRPENNVASETLNVFSVVTHDLAITSIDGPFGECDTLHAVTPCATVRNWGCWFESCWVFFNVVQETSGRTVYNESCYLRLGPGGQLQPHFPPVRFVTLGHHIATCSLYLQPDGNPFNDVHKVPFWVYPREEGGTGITGANLPHDTLDTLTAFDPWVRLRNHGPDRDSGLVRLRFYNPDYADSVGYGLSPGEETIARLARLRFRRLGWWDGVVMLWSRFGGMDTCIHLSFYVVPMVSVAEGEAQNELRPRATVVRGVLFLGGGSGFPAANGRGNDASPTFLCDAAGREVMALKPGPNDVRHLPAGVYFVVTPHPCPLPQGARAPGGRVARTKVLVAR